jgi:hypothetical protein
MNHVGTRFVLVCLSVPALKKTHIRENNATALLLQSDWLIRAHAIYMRQTSKPWNLQACYSHGSRTIWIETKTQYGHAIASYILLHKTTVSDSIFFFRKFSFS